MLLRIGTRGSPLALAQSQWVKEKILTQCPEAQVELIRIKTTGDKVLDSPLSRIGGKGLFVKEIEDALLRQEIDLAVHSMKDVPADLPQGLILAAYPEREDPRDALLTSASVPLEGLPQAAKVGTSSLRRAAQILHLRPDVTIMPLRGNVDTRIRKLEAGEFHGIILAAAGLRRLGHHGLPAQIPPLEKVLPAIGQGSLGIEAREGDKGVIEILSFLDHPKTRLTVMAERAFLRELKGGCQVPIAGLARVQGDGIFFEGLVADLEGRTLIREALQGSLHDPETLGVSLARKVLSRGADQILAGIYGGLRWMEP